MSVQSVKATINGQDYTLTLNADTGKYEATVTAPSKSSFNQSGGYYNVNVSAVDDAGNITTVDANDATYGTSLRLFVKERVIPVITVISPTSGAYISTSKPSFTWKVTDDDSGVDANTISIAVDGGGAITGNITKTPISGGYECSYTHSAALGDGSHTVVFNAKDNDGNIADQKSITITVDTVAPVLTITSPTEGAITNTATITVSGITNDATSSPVTLTVNGEPVTLNSDGTFSTSVTLVNGNNTITVIATDAAGKITTVTRHVKLDTGAPRFASVSVAPNPVDAGKTYVISVSVVDD